MSEMNPAGVSPSGVRPLAEDEHDSADDAMPEVRPSKSVEREGLPSSYRMRADPHYVDQLTARRDLDRQPPRDLQRTSARTDPDAVRAVLERESERETPVKDGRDGLGAGSDSALLDEIARSVAAIGTAAAQLGGSRSSLARRASVDVVAAEAWRAEWLTRAASVVAGRAAAQVRSRQVGPVLAEVRDRLTPEFRLSGRPLHLIATDWNATMDVDAAALVTAVTGAVVSTLGLLESVESGEGAGVRITVRVASGSLEAIEISQDDVTVADALIRRVFDATWTDRPGGFAARLGALAARAFMRAHGGEASVSGGRRGSTIRLVFEPIAARTT